VHLIIPNVLKIIKKIGNTKAVMSPQLHLRVGIPSHAHPFIFECGIENDGDFEVRNNCRYPGISLEIFDFLMQATKINYTLIRINVTDGYGSPQKDGETKFVLFFLQ
jgi:hypothetical protein